MLQYERIRGLEEDLKRALRRHIVCIPSFLPLLSHSLATADDSNDSASVTMNYQTPVMYDAYNNRSLGGLRSRRQSLSHGADPYYSTPMQPVGLHPDVSPHRRMSLVQNL